MKKSAWFVFIVGLLFLLQIRVAFSDETDPPVVEPTSPVVEPTSSTGGSSGGSSGGGHGGYINIDDGTPTLKLASDSMITLLANSKQEVEVNIQNGSSYYANNIIVQAAVSGSDIPFKMEFLEHSNVRNTLQHGATMKLKLQIDVDKNAVSGTYPVALSYTYVNSSKMAFSGSDTLLIRIESDLLPPTIVLTDITTNKAKIKSGETIKLAGKIENIGDQDAFDLRIALEGLDPKTVSLAGGVNTLYFKEYNQDFKNDIHFDLIASKEAATGSYPVNFKITYKNKKGQDFTQTYSYYVLVTNEVTDDTEKANITIVHASAPTETMAVGQQFQVTLDLQNIGVHDAKNIKVTAQAVEEGAIVPKTASIQQVTQMAPNEKKQLLFSFAPTAKSKSQNYAVGFKIEYETGATKEDKPEVISFDQFVGVNVVNPEADKKEETEKDAKKSEPKIIVSKYETNPLIVEAGKKFDLFMTFKNSHSTKSVENIKLYITVDEKTEEKGNVFSPDNSSNTFYIDSIAPKGEVSHVFHMFTVPDALARTYTIIVKFEYEDAEGNPLTTSELVGINVKQVSKLDHSEIVIPAEGYVGQPVPVNFQIYNTGKVTLSNLMIKLEGNFDTSNASMFYGNFDSGNSEYFDGVFIPNATGEQAGKIVISYDDTNGASVKTSQDFKINITDAPPPVDVGAQDGGGQPEAVSLMTKITNVLKNKFFWLGAVAFGVVVFFVVKFIRKKIRKQKGLDFYE